jgi:hypothetical protein
VLPTWPVLEVTAVTDEAGTAVTGYTLSDAAVLTLPWTPYGAITVTATVGRDPVSAAIRLATYVIAAHLWRTQQGSSPSVLQDEGLPPAGMGYGIPNRAMDLLQPHLKPPSVA